MFDNKSENRDRAVEAVRVRVRVRGRGRVTVRISHRLLGHQIPLLHGAGVHPWGCDHCQEVPAWVQWLRVRVGTRCFVVTGRHKGMLCVWQRCGRRR